MKEYKKIDNTISRHTLSRHNVLNELWIKGEGTFYLKLTRQYPHLKKYKNCEIRRIIREFNKEFVSHICKNRAGIKLPYGLGHIFVATRENAIGKINHKHSALVNKKVRYNCMETNSKVCGIQHTTDNTEKPYDGHYMWRFISEEWLRKLVSSNYKKDYRKYIVIREKQYIKTLTRIINKAKEQN